MIIPKKYSTGFRLRQKTKDWPERVSGQSQNMSFVCYATAAEPELVPGVQPEETQESCRQEYREPCVPQK